MKYLALMFAVLVGAISCVYAQATRSAAASQAWVENYVSNVLAKSAGQLVATTTTTEKDGIVTIQVGEGKLIMEDASDAALKVVDTYSAVTNGMLFVWNGKGKYINPVGNIQSTSTNLVYQGVSSFYENGILTFAGHFKVRPVLIQPSVSYSITNKMEVVR